jgi:hypothetical protein
MDMALNSPTWALIQTPWKKTKAVPAAKTKKTKVAA